MYLRYRKEQDTREKYTARSLIICDPRQILYSYDYSTMDNHVEKQVVYTGEPTYVNKVSNGIPKGKRIYRRTGHS